MAVLAVWMTLISCVITSATIWSTLWLLSHPTDFSLTATPYPITTIFLLYSFDWGFSILDHVLKHQFTGVVSCTALSLTALILRSS